MKQRTIQTSTSIKGVGLHSGRAVTMTFQPAPVNHGFRFQRVDLPDAPVIMADINNVVSTNRGTTIKHKDAQVSTIEHTLSALVGCNIDNILIEIDGPEVPIMDGSSIYFVRALEAAGIVEQEADREYYEVTEPIAYRDEVTGVELLAFPSTTNDLSITTMIDFKSPVIGHQYASLEGIEQYKKEIAPCRTFVFLHELEQLLAQNLIKGGDLDNAIVIVDRIMQPEELEKLALKLGKPGVKVEKEGILNTVSLHFTNEPARHKLLDMIGDLALIGKPFKGKIVATKPGHTGNIAFAKLLKRHFTDMSRKKAIPKYDPNQESIYDINDIMKKLPHRYPFLLVDKIIEISDYSIVGVKHVTFNEYFFQGHFPDNPVFPGVLQLEALAQTGGIMILKDIPEGEVWDTYFLKINNARFKQKVLPGDTLILKLELTAPLRRGVVEMFGTAYVGGKIVSEAELMAQIIKRQ